MLTSACAAVRRTHPRPLTHTEQSLILEWELCAQAQVGGWGEALLRPCALYWGVRGELQLQWSINLILSDYILAHRACWAPGGPFISPSPLSLTPHIISHLVQCNICHCSLVAMGTCGCWFPVVKRGGRGAERKKEATIRPEINKAELWALYPGRQCAVKRGTFKRQPKGLCVAAAAVLPALRGFVESCLVERTNSFPPSPQLHNTPKAKEQNSPITLMRFVNMPGSVRGKALVMDIPTGLSLGMNKARGKRSTKLSALGTVSELQCGRYF